MSVYQGETGGSCITYNNVQSVNASVMIADHMLEAGAGSGELEQYTKILS